MDPTPDIRRGLDPKGLAAAFAAFGVWGLFPFLFQAMGRAGAGPLEILAWRAPVAVPLAILVAAAAGRAARLGDLVRHPRRYAPLLVSAALIGSNWAVYIWAVESGRTLSASLGYYINPLLSVLAAALLFRERIGPSGRVALGLAGIGVVLQAVALGQAPWVSLFLAATFCGYGVVRKAVQVDARTGILVESLALLPPSLALIAWLETSGRAVFGTGLAPSLLLMLGGPATVFPFVAFAVGARRLPLSALGFIQYVTPTMLFVIGALQGEPLGSLRLASFAFIWAGVVVFAFGAWRPRPATA